MKSRARFYGLGLVLLLGLVAVNNVVFVIQEQGQVRDDALTNVVATVGLREAVTSLTSESWQRWVRLTEWRPPLTAVLYQPLALVIPDQLLAIRLTDQIFFLLSLWLVYRMGIILSGPAVGLLAAFMFAVYPEVQGWSRVGNADPIIWFTALLFLRVLLTLDLRNPWQAALLGLTAGLCTATRLLSFVFLIGPVLWLLSFKLRDRRSLLHMLAAGAYAISVAGWWYVMQLETVLGNLDMSQTQVLTSQLTPFDYLGVGWGFVLAGTVPALLYLWRRRLIPRGQLLLLLLSLVLPALQFTFIWAVWSRYPLALIPVCALLVALALEQLTSSWRSGLRRAAWIGAAAVGVFPLLMNSISLQLTLSLGLPRGEGLLSPCREPHDGLYRATAKVPVGAPVLNINDSGFRHYPRGIVIRENPPRLNLVNLPDRDDPFTITRSTDVRYVLRTQLHCEWSNETDCVQPAVPVNSWWSEQAPELAKQRLVSTRDPDGMEFQLWRLERPLHLEP